MRAVIKKEITSLAANLRNGVRLLCLRPASPRLRYSLHQIVLLIAVTVLIALVVDYVRHRPNPEFNRWAVAGEAMSLAGVLFVAYLVAIAMRDGSKALRFVVQVYSVAPFMYLIGVVLHGVRPWGVAAAWVIWGLLSVWFLAVAGFILHYASGRRLRRTGAYVASYAALVVAPPLFFWTGDYWYPRMEEPKSPAAYQKLNQEQLYYAQPARIEAATATLAPGRRGVTDLYFVGFGGYGSEDVFMKEVRFAQDVFDRNFGTAGRSVALINNPTTVDDAPLATVSNLKEVLKRIGRKMNRDEDVLFLFLTSHGTRNELSVSFRPLRLNDITPSDLKTALDESGIKWRVLMISACYSGSFIEPLKDDHTLVATASAPDKQSFGCGNESEFTYFGKAVFDEQLKTERYFPAAFAKAAESIKGRELTEGKELSDPRLYVGSAIASKLRDLEKRFTVRTAR